MKRRVLAMVVAVIMIVVLLPGTALAHAGNHDVHDHTVGWLMGGGYIHCRIEAGPGGTIWSAHAQDIPCKNLTWNFKAVPDNGYRFVGWTYNGNEVSGAFSAANNKNLSVKFTEKGTKHDYKDYMAQAVFEKLPDIFKVSADDIQNNETISVSYGSESATLVKNSPTKTFMMVPGQQVTFTASHSNSHKRFKQWENDGWGAAHPKTFTPQAFKTYKPNPKWDTYYDLTYSASPTVGGTVTVDPAGTSFKKNTPVTLSATAARGYEFTGWSGAGWNLLNGDRKVRMTEDKTVTATFKKQFSLSVSADSNGKLLTPGLIQHTYLDGDTVNLTLAGPVPHNIYHYRFAGWQDDNNPATFLKSDFAGQAIWITMDSDKSYTAVFEGRLFELRAWAESNGHLNDNINGDYKYGTTVNLNTANPEGSTGYEFLYWEELVGGKWKKVGLTGGEPIITVGEVNDYRAVFGPKQYTITTSATHGTITPNQTVNHGDNKTISYNPHTNYHLVSVMVDGMDVTSTNPTSYTFSDVQATHDIEVVYAIDTYLIDTTVTNGTITPGDTNVDHGANQTFTFSADPNHNLVSVTVDGMDVTSTNPTSYTFSDVQATHDIEVVYAIDTYLIDTTVTNGTITPGDTNVDHGANQTFTYSANPNHHLVSVTVDGMDVTSTNLTSYTFSDVQATHDIEVVYAIDTYLIDTTIANGTITPGDTNVDHGANQTFTYSANPNHHLVSVTVDGMDVTSTNPTSYTFSDVQATHDIEVVYAIDTYLIDTTVTNGTITPGDTNVNHGANQTFTYSANPNHHLVSVTVDGMDVTSTNPTSYTFSDVQANHTIEVVYAIDTYLIDTTVTKGTITPDHTVDHGSDTTVTYSADANHHLVSVTVDGTPVDITTYPNSYTFSGVDADHTIEVVYVIDTYAIDTTVTNGTITPDHTVDHGSDTTVTYSADANHHLVSVTVDGTPVDIITYPDSYTFSGVDTDHTIEVVYAIDTYTIDTTVTNGTITGDHSVDHGDDTTVTYSADANHHLVSVTVDGTPVDITTYPDSYTFSGVDSNHTIEVVYAIDTYTIDTTATNGTITGDHSVDHGDDTTVTYSADANHHLVSVTVDGTPVDITTYPDSYTFSGVDTDHTIEVVYAIDTYTIDTTVTNGTITGDHSVDHGDDTTVTYSADANHHLVSVTVDGTPVDITTYPDSYTFSGVDSNHTIEVVYAIDTYTIDTTVINGLITGDHSVDHGDDTTVTYSADANHHLVSVTVDGTPVDITTYPDSYTFSGVETDHTIEVVYAIDTYAVTFFERDGVTPIGTPQAINWDAAAVLETAPAIDGHAFDTWVLTGDDDMQTDSLLHVRENLTAVASYVRNGYTVTFADFDGTVLGTDGVLYGGEAMPPLIPEREGHTFVGWSEPLDPITGTITVTAQYKINTFAVQFVDHDGSLIDTQTVDWNTGATAPADPSREGYTFTGWDKAFDPVTENITVTAQYKKVTDLDEEDIPKTEDTEILDEEVPLAATPQAGFPWWWILIGIGAAAGLFLILFFWKRRKKDEQEA